MAAVRTSVLSADGIAFDITLSPIGRLLLHGRLLSTWKIQSHPIIKPYHTGHDVAMIVPTRDKLD